MVRVKDEAESSQSHIGSGGLENLRVAGKPHGGDSALSHPARAGLVPELKLASVSQCSDSSWRSLTRYNGRRNMSLVLIHFHFNQPAC